MEFIYKLRYKTNGLYISRNSLGEYILILCEDAEIYRTFEQIPQQIKLSCGTELTRDELEIVKFAVIPHEIVEFAEPPTDFSYYIAGDYIHPSMETIEALMKGLKSADTFILNSLQNLIKYDNMLP